MTTPDAPQPADEPPTNEPGDIDFTSSIFFQPRAVRAAAGAGPAAPVPAAGPAPAETTPSGPADQYRPAHYDVPQYPPAQHLAPPYPQTPYDPLPYPQAQHLAPPYSQTPYAVPPFPLRPPPRRRRTYSGVSIALVLALLAGVLGGGYWLANRNVHAASVSNPDTKPVALPTQLGRSLDTVTAAPAPPVPSTSVTGGGYLYRSKAFTVRFPHRPSVRSVPVPSEVALSKALMISDDRDYAAVEWAKFTVVIPVTEQTSALEGVVRGLGESGRFTTSNERITTFHGHPARLVTLRSQDGMELTALAAVYRPTHLLLILGQSGRQFDLVAGSFTLRG